MTLNKYFTTQRKRIDKQLDRILPSGRTYPKVLHEAMRYSVFSGGKRIRPILVLAACEACGAKPERALLPACAIELIHTWTLIHDDLPCMDNDDLRRGRPTCHRRFGEANAILAGTALLSLAFDVLGRVRPAERAAELTRSVAEAVGSTGVISGQVVDKLYEKKEVNLPTLDYISTHKTGYLIKASCWAGGVAANSSKVAIRHILRYGEYLGLAFQVIDDLLDGDGYRRIMSPQETHSLAGRLIDKATNQARYFGKKGKRLTEIAEFILKRKK